MPWKSVRLRKYKDRAPAGAPRFPKKPRVARSFCPTVCFEASMKPFFPRRCPGILSPDSCSGAVRAGLSGGAAADPAADFAATPKTAFGCGVPRKIPGETRRKSTAFGGRRSHNGQPALSGSRYGSFAGKCQLHKKRSTKKEINNERNDGTPENQEGNGRETSADACRRRQFQKRSLCISGRRSLCRARFGRSLLPPPLGAGTDLGRDFSLGDPRAAAPSDRTVFSMHIRIFLNIVHRFFRFVKSHLHFFSSFALIQRTFFREFTIILHFYCSTAGR